MWDNDVMHPNDQVKAILDTVKFIVLSTVDADGQPWNSPVAAFRFTNDYTFYWASWHDTQHSRNIRANSKVFVVVFDSTPPPNQPPRGVYMRGRAVELTDEEEVMKAALVFGDNAYNPSDGAYYLGDHPRRIYKFVPEQWWTNDRDTINGDPVDMRRDVAA